MRAVGLELLLLGVFTCSLQCAAFQLHAPVRCRLTLCDQHRKPTDGKQPINSKSYYVHRSQCRISLEMAANSDGATDVSSQMYPESNFVSIENVSPESSDHMKSVIESVVGDWRDRYGDTLSHFRESPRSPGTAPTLAEYMRRGDFHPQELLDRLQNLKGLNVENFGRILDDGRHYVLRGVEEGESLSRAVADVFARVPADRISQSIQSFATVLQTQGANPESLQAALRALNMEELGVWYVGALGFVSLLAASTSSVSARKDLESKLSEATATLGKETEEASLREQTLLAEKERMQSQVKELTQATAAVSKELKELKAEKARSDYAVAELKSELRALQNELKIQKAKETEVVSNLADAEKRLQSETQRLKSELEEKARAEKDLNERIRLLQVQLGLEEGSPTLSIERPTSLSGKNAAADGTSSTVKNAEAQGVFFASVEAPVNSPANEPPSSPVVPAKKKTTKRATSTTTPAVDSVDTKPSKTSATKAVSKGTTGKPEVPTETKPKKAKGSTSETITVKKSPAKQVEKSTVAVKDPVDDWSKLSPAAIKRKTLSELAAFLESKGLPSLGSDGKPMKKQDLVDKILDVLKL